MNNQVVMAVYDCPPLEGPIDGLTMGQCNSGNHATRRASDSADSKVRPAWDGYGVDDTSKRGGTSGDGEINARFNADFDGNAD